MKRFFPIRNKGGFTLPELLVASGLAGVVLAAFVGAFLSQRIVFARKELEQELQQNVRHAMRAIQHDIQNAGGGLVMGTRKMSDWFALPAVSGVTDIPYIVDGGTGPDELVTAGYSGAPVATLEGNAYAGATSIEIDLNDDTVSPYQPRVGDVLVLAGVEAVQVVSKGTLNDNRLTIRTNPLESGSGLRLDYPDGVDIFLLNVIHYRVETNAAGVPGVVRQDSRFDYGGAADMRIAEHIEDLQFTRNGELVEVTLTGRTRKPVPGYTQEADERPRYTLSTSVQIGNPTPRLMVVAWPNDILMSPTPTPTP